MIGTDIDARIVTPSPSAAFGFYLAQTTEDGPLIGVALVGAEGRWNAIGTPWLAIEVAAMEDGFCLAVDDEGIWQLSATESVAFREFATSEILMNQLLLGA